MMWTKRLACICLGHVPTENIQDPDNSYLYKRSCKRCKRVIAEIRFPKMRLEDVANAYSKKQKDPVVEEFKKRSPEEQTEALTWFAAGVAAQANENHEEIKSAFEDTKTEEVQLSGGGAFGGAGASSSWESSGTEIHSGASADLGTSGECHSSSQDGYGSFDSSFGSDWSSSCDTNTSSDSSCDFSSSPTDP